MTSKKRDPEFTGRLSPPWTPEELCPCGSGRHYAHCCRLPNGDAYKQFTWPVPPGPRTGIRHESCYLRHSANCCETISSEHYVSQSVLKLLGEQHVKITGAPWLPAGSSQSLPIGGVVAKVLCKRHNEALAPLDAVAGQFFQNLRWIFDNQLDRKTLSRRNRWFLLSGEQLELWMLKVALGMFYGGIVAKDGNRFRDRHDLDPTIANAFEGASLPSTCWLSVHQERSTADGARDELNCIPILDDAAERMVGLRLQCMGVPLLQMIDPRIFYGSAIREKQISRPTYVIFKGRTRRHTIVLTWPPAGPTKNAAQFSEQP